MNLLNKLIPVSKETMNKEVEKVKQSEQVMYQQTISNITEMYENKIEKLEKENNDFRIFLEKLPPYYKMLFYTENHISIEVSKVL